jgi:small subunit ribosomal protein S21
VIDWWDEVPRVTLLWRPHLVYRERITVVEIELAETDRLDWALKQFRRKMIRSGLFKDMRRKRFYEKPSEARKAKAKAAERRRHKDRKRAARARRLDF